MGITLEDRKDGTAWRFNALNAEGQVTGPNG